MNPVKLSAVLWDLDDTLVNTRERTERSQARALAEIGIAAPDIERGVRAWQRLYWYFDANDVIGILEAISYELNVKPSPIKMKKVAQNVRNDWGSGVRVFPGVPATLEWFIKRGMLLGIVSNGSPETQMRKISNAGLEQYFPAHGILILPPSSGHSKPSATGLARVCAALASKPRETLYVGNRYSDCIASNLAGVLAILIPSGSFEFKEPEGSPSLRIETPRLVFENVERFHAWMIEHLDTDGFLTID
jgi:FMN phosphatase YigB (HAD superfamily)